MALLGIFGAPNVEKLKAKGDVGGVTKALAYQKDKDVRAAAAMALAEMGTGAAVEPLIRALTDEVSQVRRAAAEALDRLGWAPDESRTGAAYHIAKGEWERCTEIGTPSVEPLLAVLRDADPGIAQGAAGALERLGEPAVKYLTPLLGNETLRLTATGILSRIGGPAVGALIASLTSEDVNARGLATQVLAKIGEPAVPPLVVALKDGNQQLRQAAASALRGIGGPAVERLSELLADPNPDVRAQAALVLGGIGDPRPLHSLIRMLGENGGVCRAAAADALGKIVDSRKGPSIFGRTMLKQTGTAGVNVMLDACYALTVVAGKRTTEFFSLGGQKGDAHALSESTAAEVLELLLGALRDADKDVRDAAAIALAKLGQAAVAPLLDLLADQDASVRAHVAIALGGIEDAKAVGPLLKALGDRSAPVRASAALALGMMEDPRCIEPLIRLLGSDPAKLVWTAAALSLGLAKGDAAVKILQARVLEKDMAVASACSASLALLGHPVNA